MSTTDETGGPRPCDCGPDERCFECATDDELLASIPPAQLGLDAAGNWEPR